MLTVYCFETIRMCSHSVLKQIINFAIFNVFSLQAMKRIPGREIKLDKWVDSAKKFLENATLESFIHHLTMIIPLTGYEGAKKGV